MGARRCGVVGTETCVGLPGNVLKGALGDLRSIHSYMFESSKNDIKNSLQATIKIQKKINMVSYSPKSSNLNTRIR